MIYNDEYPNDVYIGSTKQKINLRMSGHKRKYNDEKYSHIHLYSFIKNNGGFNDWKCKALNQTDFINDDWRRKQEQCYIDCYKPSLNTKNSYLTIEEKKERDNICKRLYEKNNKEKVKQIKKKYEEENKKKRDEYKLQYRETNREELNRKAREKNKMKLKT